MSARTPFVPSNPRPASRSHIKEQLQPANSLKHEESATKSQPESEAPTQNAAVPKNPFRPLNTGNLQKKNNNTAENRPARSSSLTRSVSRPSDQSNDAQNNTFAPAETFTSSFKPTNFPMNPALQISSDMQFSDLLPLNPNAFKLNLSHSNSGSQRVSADPGHGPDRTDTSQAVVLPRPKRGLADTEVEGSEAFFEGGQQKRYKVDTEDRKLSQTMGYVQFSPQTILSSPAESHHSDFRHSTESQPFDPDFDVQHQYPPVYQAAPPSESAQEGHFLSSGAISRLLGRDVDLYIEDRAEKYERLAAKWRDCTMEEWTAGAAELTAKHTRILDFVKSHMLSKLKLFSGLDSHVDDQNKVLAERHKTLGGVKQKLLSEAGNLLGRDNSV